MADRSGVRAGGGIYPALAVRDLVWTDPAPGGFAERSAARAVGGRGADQHRLGTPASLPASSTDFGDGPVQCPWLAAALHREGWPEPIRGFPLAGLHRLFDRGQHPRPQELCGCRTCHFPPAPWLRPDAARQLRPGIRRVGLLCDCLGTGQDPPPPLLAWRPPRGTS